MTLDRLWQLDSTNATSNSNFAGANIAENCAPSGINNALRSLGVMVTRELAFQSAAISSSASTNIVTSSTGLYMNIKGTNAINSFGVVPGEQPSASVFRILAFSSSASLVNSSVLNLIGRTSRRTHNGEIGGYIHTGSGDTWHELFYSRVDGALPADSISVTTITNRSMSTSAISTVTLNAASASITAIGITALRTVASLSASVGDFTLLRVGGKSPPIFHGRATNAAYTSTATDIPSDDSIPTSSEGAEALSLTVTPTNAASIMLLEVGLNLGGGAGGQASAALFEGAGAAAFAAASVPILNTGTMTRLQFSHSITASSTSQRIYRVRYGPDASTVTAYLNGDATSRTFGGVAVSSLTVWEILP